VRRRPLHEIRVLGPSGSQKTKFALRRRQGSEPRPRAAPFLFTRPVRRLTASVRATSKLWGASPATRWWARPGDAGRVNGYVVPCSMAVDQLRVTGRIPHPGKPASRRLRTERAPAQRHCLVPLQNRGLSLQPVPSRMYSKVASSLSPIRTCRRAPRPRRNHPKHPGPHHRSWWVVWWVCDEDQPGAVPVTAASIAVRSEVLVGDWNVASGGGPC